MKRIFLPRAGLAVCCLLLNAVTATAEVRTWTDDINRTWQGEFVRTDGPSALFLVNGKEFPFPIAHLSAADKLLIFKLRHAPVATPAPVTATAPIPTTGAEPASASSPTSAAPGKNGSFGAAQIEPGKTVETDLTLATKDSQTITQAFGAQTPITHIRASLAVPSNFDGDKPQKVLVVAATATGSALSIPVAKSIYTKDALEHGYLVLAADGPDGKPKSGVTPMSGDSPHYRLTLLAGRSRGTQRALSQSQGGMDLRHRGFLRRLRLCGA